MTNRFGSTVWRLIKTASGCVLPSVQDYIQAHVLRRQFPMVRAPSIGKMCNSGMKPRFDGSQWNIEDVANLFIGKLMKITQKEDFPEVVGHGHDGLLDELLKLFTFHGLAGHGFGGLHEVNELAGFIVAGADGGLERIGRAAGLAADEIARFVGGDGEQPGTKAARGVKLGGGLMNLEEGFLEDILGRGAVAQETDQEVIQLTLIA